MSFKLKNTSKIVELNLHLQVPECGYDLQYKESHQILSYLILCNKRKYMMEDREGYVLMPSEKMKKTFGKYYCQGLRELRERELIEPKWHYINGNESYPVYYSKELGISASYRISSLVENSMKYGKCSFVPIKEKYTKVKPKNGRFKFKYKSKNPKARKVLAAYSGISVDPSWVEIFQKDSYYPANHHKYPSEPVNKYSLFVHCKWVIESIQNKTLLISAESESGRVFHAILEVTKIIRPYILKDGQKLLTIDAKSFHPYLIASYISDKNQREKYLSIVRNNGFYEQFSDNKNSRDSIKILFQKYLSGRPASDPKVLQIAKWFDDNFPEVSIKMMELKNNKMTFQMCLQQLESSIFVDEVFMKADFWCLPMHDGICVLPSDEDAARELINRACESRLGYCIQLDSH